MSKKELSLDDLDAVSGGVGNPQKGPIEMCEDKLTIKKYLMDNGVDEAAINQKLGAFDDQQLVTLKFNDKDNWTVE